MSRMRLYADDCGLYRPITSEDDCRVLQCDLNLISEWCRKWNMTLNLDKTVLMSFIKKKNARLCRYTLDNFPLSQVYKYKYLGVYFTHDLKWHCHVDHIVASAGKSLGFLG